MTTVRYGARSQQVNREIEAKKNADIWSQAVTAVYETDPEIVAAVLPPPLEPGPEPLVRVTITRVEMPGLPVFGAGWIGVQARHEDRLGEYPILMPMTTEQSLIGGREVNGEPKKLAEVEVARDGGSVSARLFGGTGHLLKDATRNTELSVWTHTKCGPGRIFTAVSVLLHSVGLLT